MYLAIGKALDQFQRLHHRAMAVVVGAELQGEQEFERHAAIVSLVGVADHCAHCGAVGRPGGLPLLDQVAQRLFVDHRKDHIANILT